jgi:hypothetical protein
MSSVPDSFGSIHSDPVNDVRVKSMKASPLQATIYKEAGFVYLEKKGE